MIKETWKDIKGFEGLYQVSNLGKVKSLSGKKPLIKKQTFDKDGYLKVTLSKKGKKYNKRIHRVVAETFIPNTNKLPQVNHKDEIKTNNSVFNLEWCSNFYNSCYGTRSKRVAQNNKIKVFQFSLENRLIKVWPSALDAGAILGICKSHISECCTGKRNTAGGFIWRHKKEAH